MFSGPETEMLLSAETGMSMLFGLEVKICLPNSKIYFKMPKKSVIIYPKIVCSENILANIKLPYHNNMFIGGETGVYQRSIPAM